MLEITEDWQWSVRRRGLKVAAPEIWEDLVHLPCRRLKFYLFKRSLSAPLPPIKTRFDMGIRSFTKEDLPTAAVINRPSEARLCERRLKAGHEGLVAVCNGKLAGYAWASSDPNAELERVPLALEPGEALCTDAFTAVEMRGQGVQSALTLARFQLLKDLGFSEGLSYITVYNRPSINVWQNKFGSELIGEFTFVRFGSWIKLYGSGESIKKRMHPVIRGS